MSKTALCALQVEISYMKKYDNYNTSWKAFVNRCVLSWDLKHSRPSQKADLLSTSGKLLNSLGAQLTNDLSPYLDLAGKTLSKNWEPERRLRPGRYTRIASLRYEGAILWIHLKTKIKILNSILKVIGSQCSFLRASVMRSDFRRRRTSLAALFWIFWSLAIRYTKQNRIYAMQSWRDKCKIDKIQWY